MKKQTINFFNRIIRFYRENKIKSSLITVLLVAILFSTVYIFQFFFQQNKNYDVYQDIKQEVDSQNGDQNSEETVGTDKINFDELWAVNPDIYAYITIPGTQISYPIVQSDTDNSYYLEHTIEKVKGYPGSIYTENYNTKNFSDRNTVIYGHNMKNKTMFSQLHEYEDKDFFAKNQYVYISLPDRTLKYKIFAAIKFDDRHLMKSYNFASASGLMSFLQETKDFDSKKNYDESVAVGKDDKIITLSTCTQDGESDNRWIVEAVLTND